jgi:F-type H+-transporting ATPase subunit b
MHETSTGTLAAPREFSMFTFDPGVGIWGLLVFFVMLMVLKKFAWKPIIQSIDERDQKIKEALSAAERVRQESIHHAEEQKQVLANAQEQAAKILGDSRRQAEVIREQLVEAAQSEKAKILHSATDEINTMKHQLESELRVFSAELAVGTAEKILRDQLDTEKAKSLANRMVKDFKP